MFVAKANQYNSFACLGVPLREASSLPRPDGCCWPIFWGASASVGAGDFERSGQASVLDLDLLVQDFTAGGIHALQTSFSSSGNPEFDSRIQKLVADWGVRDSHDLIAEMIVTALRMGSDAVPVADLKLINRSLKELRLASKAFAPYQGSRKIAIFGSARTNSNTEEFRAAERFASLMRESGFMIITGGGDGIMGAAQRERDAKTASV